MSEEYRFEGNLTFEDYHECHFALAFMRRLVIRGICLIYGVGTVLYVLLSNAGMYLLLGIGIFLILYAIVISPIQFRLRVRRIWDNYPKAHQPFSFLVAEEGLTAKDDRGNPVFTGWDNFLKYRETKSLFMIHLSPHMPLCLPKRLLASNQLDPFRDLLERKLGKG